MAEGRILSSRGDVAVLEKGRFARCEKEVVSKRVQEVAGNNSIARLITEALVEKKSLLTIDIISQAGPSAVGVLRALAASGVVEKKRGAGRIDATEDGLFAAYSLAFDPADGGIREEATELLRTLDPRLSLGGGGWLATHPGRAVDNRECLVALNEWLASPASRGGNVGMRERAYEIWGDEKALESGDVKPLLRRVGFDLSLLRTHPTAPDLFHYRFDVSFEGTVVVSENQEMWDSLSRMLGKGRLLGSEVSGAVFGSGNAATADGGERLAVFLADQGVSVGRCVYIGDIDPSGVRMQQAVEDGVGIRPWRPMYEKMALLHAARRAAGKPARRHLDQDAGDIKRFLMGLENVAARDEAAWAFDNRVRIPQEIVNLSVMERMTNGDR